MSPQRRSTLRAWWLGQQLKELREANGLTVRDAGAYLQRSSGTISRFESADYPIRRGDVLALLDLYGVSDEPRRRNLIRLGEEVWQKGWWDGYADAVDQRFIDYPWLESRATKLRAYETMLVTGLLQTRDYAQVLIEDTNGATAGSDQIAQWVNFRMERQQVLDQEEPLQVELVLDESVLRRVIGEPDTMRAQLTHLVESARRPNIEIRVLPLRPHHKAGLEGSFKLFTMPEPYPEVGYVDTPAGAVYVETPDTDRFATMYDRLWDITLEADESAELISAAAEELQ